MSRFSIIFALALSFFLWGCSEGPDNKEDAAKKPAQTGMEATIAQVPAPASAAQDDSTLRNQKGKPDPEELERASRLVAYANRARAIAQKGHYALPELLQANTRQYLESWKLPRQPLPAKHAPDNRLKAPAGLFGPEEEKQLATSLDRMDKAINSIIGHYRELGKYVADASIVDDGKKGVALGKQIAAGHAEYMQARRSWLEIINANAYAAEEKLLQDHPLQRQILAARQIFEQMAQVESLMRAEDDERTLLLEICKNMTTGIEEAGRPPFQGKPALERLYRGFLKAALNYCLVLDRGILEGLFSVQKREILAAAINCRLAYNNFVRAANTLAEGREEQRGKGNL